MQIYFQNCDTLTIILTVSMKAHNGILWLIFSTINKKNAKNCPLVLHLCKINHLSQRCNFSFKCNTQFNLEQVLLPYFEVVYRQVGYCSLSTLSGERTVLPILRPHPSKKHPLTIGQHDSILLTLQEKIR